MVVRAGGEWKGGYYVFSRSRSRRSRKVDDSPCSVCWTGKGSAVFFFSVVEINFLAVMFTFVLAVISFYLNSVLLRKNYTTKSRHVALKFSAPCVSLVRLCGWGDRDSSTIMSMLWQWPWNLHFYDNIVELVAIYKIFCVKKVE